LTSEVGAGRVLGRSDLDVAPHNCFACGTLNEHGLGLRIHVEHGRSWTELTLDERFEGWAGIAHGGILCTLLDEVMAWALAGSDAWGVTARLAVDFRAPVPVGASLRAEGWIVRSRRRLVETRARIVDPAGGHEYATAAGTYVTADATRQAELRARYAFRAPSVARTRAVTPVPVAPA
jgi:uncharacterized protein (TIGR00369 family)